MDFLDVQAFIGIKLLFLFFVLISFCLLYKNKKPVYFLGLVGLVSAASFFIFVNNLQLPLFGLQGDEITLAAMYNTFAHVGFGADFAYHNLVSFYPPAFFWFFGSIGKLLNLNGIVIYKLAAFSFFLVFPLSLYYFQRYLLKDKFSDNKWPQTIFLLLSPLLIITILDKDLMIGKPYEIIAAAATIFWGISLYLKITQGKFDKKQLLIHGMIAGLIFMTYYLWLLFAAIALLLLGIFENTNYRFRYFLELIKTAIITTIVALPYLLPLIISYLKNGMESWQTAYFTPDGLDLWLPMFKFDSFNSLILLFGLATLIFYRKRVFIRQLCYLFLTAFIWWGIGMLSLLIFKIPFQEFRGFYIWAPMILAIAAAYGIERLILHFRASDKKDVYITICVIGILYFASQSIFGFFIDNAKTKTYHEGAKELKEPIASLVKYLEHDNRTSSKLTLETVPQALAYVPINNLLYFNQHNNNPAAIFSKRYDYVKSLASSRSANELFERVKGCPYGNLERFVFYEDNGKYYLYFHLDKIIEGIETKEIIFNQDLFKSDHFSKSFEKNGYVVIDVIN